MNSLNILNYSIAIGFLVLVGFISYAAFSLSKSLNELTSIFEKIDDIAKDANELKDIIKKGISILIGMFVKKGGDKNGK